MEMNVGKAMIMRIPREPSTVQIMTDQKELENLEYFNYLCSMLTNDARCTGEIKSRIAMTKAAFSKKKAFQQLLGLTFKEQSSKVLHLEHSIL
jgi:hypothetical protein